MDTTFKVSLSLNVTTDIHDDRPIYLAGTFNDWNENDENFRLQKMEDGQYFFHFTEVENLQFPIEYKYTKGSWQEVELGEAGESRDNRVLNELTEEVNDHVPFWKRNGQNYLEHLLPKIVLLSKDFEMPQLVKTRRVAALLPYDYFESEKQYPVLYLQDGQNLFDDHAPYGSWELDKKLALMAERGMADIIVIAIDHAEEDRIEEFTPSSNTRLGSGDGKKYARFLADTLKPYVDKHFRTLADQSNTGIGGSSMGALISIYAGFMYPEVYSKLLIFSPSLWVNPRIKMNNFHFDEQLQTKIYLYAGAKESKTMVPNIIRFRDNIFQSGMDDLNINFKLAIDPDGEHNEKQWGKEFPKAIKWLFY